MLGNKLFMLSATSTTVITSSKQEHKLSLEYYIPVRVITYSAISVYLCSARYKEQSFHILGYKKSDIYLSNFINTSYEEILTNLWLRIDSYVDFRYFRA
jgi:hypothetical protein